MVEPTNRRTDKDLYGARHGTKGMTVINSSSSSTCDKSLFIGSCPLDRHY